MPCVSASITVARLVVEVGELGAEALELLSADVDAELVQAGDQRRDLARGALVAVALDLGRQDLADLADLAPAQVGGALRVVLQVVEVEQRHVGDVAHAGIDVARQGDVEDQQRTRRPGMPSPSRPSSARPAPRSMPSR